MEFVQDIKKEFFFFNVPDVEMYHLLIQNWFEQLPTHYFKKVKIL